MTKRQRVIAAIRHEATDYTPHNVIFTGQMLEKMIRHTGNPDYADTINNHILRVPLRKPYVPAANLAEGHVDEFGVEWDQSGADKDIGVPVNYIIKNADELAAYIPPALDEAAIRGSCEKAVATRGDRFTFGSVGFSFYERAWSLCGMENMLCYMVTDPDAVESLFDKLLERNLEKVRIASEYDIDGIMFGDDWGQQNGMIMGAPLWRKLIKPQIAKLYAAARAAGKFVAQHSCGDLREILDDLIDIGLDVYQTFQTEIYDMNEYKRKLNGKLAIWGGISTQTQLPFKTPEEIYDITMNAISVMGKGGGYIAAPTHDVTADVPPENILAMVKAFNAQKR